MPDMDKPSIEYKVSHPLTALELARVFEEAGLAHPANDLDRMRRMIEGANLVVSAWHDGSPVGAQERSQMGAFPATCQTSQ